MIEANLDNPVPLNTYGSDPLDVLRSYSSHIQLSNVRVSAYYIAWWLCSIASKCHVEESGSRWGAEQCRAPTGCMAGGGCMDSETQTIKEDGNNSHPKPGLGYDSQKDLAPGSGISLQASVLWVKSSSMFHSSALHMDSLIPRARLCNTQSSHSIHQLYSRVQSI